MNPVLSAAVPLVMTGDLAYGDILDNDDFIFDYGRNRRPILPRSEGIEAVGRGLLIPTIRP